MFSLLSPTGKKTTEMNIMNNTFYFPNKNSIKIATNRLTSKIIFDNKFRHKKETYLENRNYLIVISKHFIRLLTFNNCTYQDLANIKELIGNINKKIK